MLLLLTSLTEWLIINLMKREASEQVTFYQQLGINIRKHRKQQRFSQDALAKLVSLTRTSLTNIEKGRQHLSVYTLCEIVEHLKVNVSELLPSVERNRRPVDLKVLAGAQVRHKDELDFIEAAIKGGK
jgi:transcriptional regulator with XRE-family HTH domain